MTIMHSLILWFLLNASTHAIYLSTSKMILDENQKEIEIQVKVFSDDLQTALVHYFNEKEIYAIADIGTKNLPQIKTYFQQHLKLNKINSNIKWAMNLEELNADYQESIYLLTAIYKDHGDEIKNAPVLEIQADYLMEVFPTQSNVIHLIHKGQDFFLRLKKNKSKEEVILRIE